MDDLENNIDDLEDNSDFEQVQESSPGLLLKQEGPIDHERVVQLISSGEWEEVLLLLTQDMDPWNIDLVKLSDRFVQQIDQMRETNLRVPARILLAAAIIYRLKSETLQYEEPKDGGFIEDEIAQSTLIDWSQANIVLPPIQMPIRRMPRRSVTIDELVNALEKAMVIKNRRENREFFHVELAGEDMSVRIEQIFEKINGFLIQNGFINFSTLLPQYRTREDVVRTFSSILHLSNQERLSCEQHELFGDITIKPFTGQVAYEENTAKREKYGKNKKISKIEEEDDGTESEAND